MNLETPLDRGDIKILPTASTVCFEAISTSGFNHEFLIHSTTYQSTDLSSALEDGVFTRLLGAFHDDVISSAIPTVDFQLWKYNSSSSSRR